MKTTIILATLLFLAVFVQVSWLPLPFGLLVIFGWFSRKGTKHIIILVLAFSLFIALLSQIPAWLVLFVTALSLYLFVLGKSFLPSRLSAIAGLVVVSLFAWEALLVGLLRVLRL
jgi:hypothetical protein